MTEAISLRCMAFFAILSAIHFTHEHGLFGVLWQAIGCGLLWHLAEISNRKLVSRGTPESESKP